MTFKEAKIKLDNIKEIELDNYGTLFANLHSELIKQNRVEEANALELAFTAMSLYCNK